MSNDVAKIHCDGTALKGFMTFINQTLHRNEKSETLAH